MQVKTVQICENTFCGVDDVRLTFKDGSALHGADRQMGNPVDVSKPLTKITTTIRRDEWGIYSIEWFFVDGSYQRMGKEYYTGGRPQTIQFANGEILIGARLHHDDNYTYGLGLEWITGRYAQ